MLFTTACFRAKVAIGLCTAWLGQCMAQEAKPFDQTFTLQGITFHVTSPNLPKGNTLKISPKGLQLDNSPFSHDIDGLGVHAVGFYACRPGFDDFGLEMVRPSFGHLAATGVAGAKKENTGFAVGGQLCCNAHALISGWGSLFGCFAILHNIHTLTTPVSAYLLECS